MTRRLDITCDESLNNELSLGEVTVSESIEQESSHFDTSLFVAVFRRFPGPFAWKSLLYKSSIMAKMMNHMAIWPLLS